MAGMKKILKGKSMRPRAAAEDFDFLMGHWSVKHHRLKTRLISDTHWERFAGSCETRPILNSRVNIDDNILILPAGAYGASSIRVFDPVQALWSIWWIDSRNANIDPP